MYTAATSIRHQSINPKRASFEAGSAEHNFARGKGLPAEEDVNILFDNMLVKLDDALTAHGHLKSKLCRSVGASMIPASSKT